MSPKSLFSFPFALVLLLAVSPALLTGGVRAVQAQDGSPPALYLPLLLQKEPPAVLAWEAIGPLEGESAMDIDVAPNNPQRLYVATGTGLYRSDNRGETWELVLPGFLRRLVFDPHQPEIVYTGPRSDADGYGILKSLDGGDTWTLYNEGMICDNLSSLSISALNPNLLFTGSF